MKTDIFDDKPHEDRPHTGRADGPGEADFVASTIANQKVMIALLRQISDAASGVGTGVTMKDCRFLNERKNSAAAITKSAIPGPVKSFGEVADILRGERAYQKRRWGRRSQDGSGREVFVEEWPSVGAFIVFIDHYLSEAKRLLATRSGDGEALAVMRKVAALCVSLAETHGMPARDPRVPVVNGHDGMAA